MTKLATTQDEPTRPIPVDKYGRQLDEFGLPLSGPFRAAELYRLGKPDPRDNPEAWSQRAPAEKSLAKMNKTQLAAAAKAAGVQIPDGATNKVAVDLIEEALTRALLPPANPEGEQPSATTAE